ncbi:MAG TPA: YbjN domain-containing protein [Stenomitos sp.]
MGQLFEAVTNFFEEDEWNFLEIENGRVLRLDITLENSDYTCYAFIDEEEHIFRFYSICPVKVPLKQRLLLAEFLTRVNYGLRIGNFEMDFEDGDIRYKTSIDVEGERLTPPFVKHLVYNNLSVMDNYLPGIMKVIYGGMSPEDAIAEIEKSEE